MAVRNTEKKAISHRRACLNLHCTNMAPTKKPTTAGKTRSSSSTTTKPTLKRVKGENFYRDAKAASRVKMLNGGKPVRDPDGKIIQAAAFQKGEDETQPGRVQPDRRWFGESTNFYLPLALN
jgi:nuclear GTP-binding protein